MTRPDLHNLPSVQALAHILLRKGVTVSEERAMDMARLVQAGTRSVLLSNPSAQVTAELDRQIANLERLFTEPRQRPVINATGVIIHTNLGRAPVSLETAQAMSEAAASNVALEVDPETGRRGGRMDDVSQLLRLLTGAESALVVNNNAAAVLLVLTALAAGRRVAVSRAEAVEIGGGFRIPDVLRESGAHLVEVGTTNRTYARDYGRAELGDGGAILKVHSSNFSISGFVAHPSLSELRQVAVENDWMLIEDLGSGTLVDTARFGMEHEPTVQESLASGVDIVTFSGDKLLGGPQAGIIVGGKELVARISMAPLARALRADKVTIAGVAATLSHYARGDAFEAVPVLKMLGAGVGELQARGAALVGRLTARGVGAELVDTTNFAGGGSLPGQSLPGVALRLDTGIWGADEVARRLRLDAHAPVYGRVEGGHILIELRTVVADDDNQLVGSVMRAWTPPHRGASATRS